MPPTKQTPTKLPAARKQVRYIGSAQKDLNRLPDEVRQEVAQALREAQLGRKPFNAKPLTGDPDFRGASVLEIVEDFDSDTYRVVITVEHSEIIYVIHAFKKKSTSGIATSRKDIQRIKTRLKRAKEDHEREFKKKKGA